MKPELTVWLDWLPVSPWDPLLILLSLLPKAGITDTPLHHAQPFMWVLGTQTQVFLF